MNGTDIRENREATVLSQAIKLVEANRPRQHTLLSGTPGLVLYYREQWLYTGNNEYAQKTVDLLYEVYESVNRDDALLYGSPLSSGVAGLAAVTILLMNDGLLGNEDINLNETDEFLFENARTMFQNQATDFLHGAFGIVHYFSQKPASEQTEKYIYALAETIQQTAIINHQHAWFLNQVNRLNENPDDINLSLSHGLSGMLLVLMNVFTKYPALTGIESIIHKGVSFLAKNRILRSPQDKDLTLYPFTISTDGSAFANNRLAWCYGDLGPVLVFHQYAALFKNPQVYATANELGTYTSTRITDSETMISDTHFCHGTAGVLQIFHALAVQTGEIHYQRAKKYWYQQTVERLQQELNINRYKGMETDLLEGLVGVVLSLLSCKANKKAGWSNLLLV
jgi:lantibiotic modifying enzyme